MTKDELEHRATQLEQFLIDISIIGEDYPGEREDINTELDQVYDELSLHPLDTEMPF